MGQRARCPRRGQRPASAVSRSEMEPNGDKRRGASAGPAVEQRNVPRQTPRENAGPHLSKAKMGQRARCPRRGQRPASAVSRSEMEPNGDKRRGASAGPAVEQRNVPRQTPRENAGPHLSKAKMGQRARCPRRGKRPAARFRAGEMEPNGDKRRGFAVGAPARRSRDGNGKIAAPVGPMTGQRGFAAGEMEGE